MLKYSIVGNEMWNVLTYRKWFINNEEKFLLPPFIGGFFQATGISALSGSSHLKLWGLLECLITFRNIDKFIMNFRNIN